MLLVVLPLRIAKREHRVINAKLSKVLDEAGKSNAEEAVRTYGGRVDFANVLSSMLDMIRFSKDSKGEKSAEDGKGNENKRQFRLASSSYSRPVSDEDDLEEAMEWRNIDDFHIFDGIDDSGMIEEVASGKFS